MVRIAIVAYPELTESDRRRIESVRDRHDPQAALIEVHFTLVFPCVALVAAIAPELASAAEAAAPFDFEIVGIETVPDALGEGAHVFLVPDERAREAIAALHDRLYAGALKPHLRRDIPFVPHMTVAAKAGIHECAALAGELSPMCRGITGTIAAIDLVDTDSRPVRTLSRCALSRGAAGRW